MTTYATEKEVVFNKEFDSSNNAIFRTCFDRSLKTAAMGEKINYDNIIAHRKSILLHAHNNNSVESIPKISHHIWVTSATNPQEISSRDLEYIKTTLRFTNNWRHIFWTNLPKLIPKTVSELKLLNVEIKQINDVNIKYFDLIKSLYSKAFKFNFAMPSDIASYVILAEYGGVYFDVDYELKQPINHLLNKYSFLVHEEPIYALYCIGNAVIGTTPEHPILKEVITLVRRNFSKHAPDYVKFACHDRAFTISAAGPIALSIAFFNKANSSKNLNDVFMTNNISLYPNSNFILHDSVGIHHSSNTWKKDDEQKIYSHCYKCITR